MNRRLAEFAAKLGLLLLVLIAGIYHQEIKRGLGDLLSTPAAEAALKPNSSRIYLASELPGYRVTENGGMMCWTIAFTGAGEPAKELTGMFNNATRDIEKQGYDALINVKMFSATGETDQEWIESNVYMCGDLVRAQ